MDFQELLNGFCGISPNVAPVINRTYLDLLYDDLSVLCDQNICEYTLGLITAAFQYFRYSLMGKHKINYEIVLKWCDLYVSIQYRALTFIKHLKNQFHSSIPEVLSHMIEFLQYEVDEIGNYYSMLLVHIELLIRLAKEEIMYTMKDIRLKAVIHLWNTVLNSGDYSAQFRALKVMAMVIENCDFNQYIPVFRRMSSKYSKIVIAEIRKVITDDMDFAKAVRKFLNTFNMVLNYERTKVFSVHCLSITFGERYRFIRSNNGERLWIDFNFRPGTISFNVQHMVVNSEPDNIFYITLKIISVKLHEGKLIIYYVKPYVSPVRENLSNDLNKCNRAVILIPIDQYQRILRNDRVLQHFHCEDTSTSVLQRGKIPHNVDNKIKDKIANTNKYCENDVGTDSGSEDENNFKDDASSNHRDRKANAKVNIRKENDLNSDAPNTSSQIFDKANVCSYRLSRSARKKAKRAAKAKLDKEAQVDGNPKVDDKPKVDDDTKENNVTGSKGRGRRSRIAKKIDLARK